MSKWQSINDKLPKEGQNVLVTAINRMAIFNEPSFFDRFIGIARYTGDGNFGIREVCYPPFLTVTHWMALPGLPNAKPSLLKRLFKR